MAESKARTRREAAQESRNKLLQAGLELLAERLQSPIDQVRSTEVAQRAGYTPGAFYHHWSSQDAFRDDLRDMVDGEVGVTLERLGEDLAGGAGDIVQGVKQACRNEIRSQSQDSRWHVQLAMMASNADKDRERTAQQYEQWVDGLARFYGDILTLLELQLRPGLTIEWFTRTIMALSEGFSLQELADSAGAPLDGDWQPYETAVAALVTATTVRPDGTGPSAESLFDRLRDLVE